GGGDDEHCICAGFGCEVAEPDGLYRGLLSGTGQDVAGRGGGADGLDHREFLLLAQVHRLAVRPQGHQAGDAVVEEAGDVAGETVMVHRRVVVERGDQGRQDPAGPANKVLGLLAHADPFWWYVAARSHGSRGRGGASQPCPHATTPEANGDTCG